MISTVCERVRSGKMKSMVSAVVITAAGTLIGAGTTIGNAAIFQYDVNYVETNYSIVGSARVTPPPGVPFSSVDPDLCYDNPDGTVDLCVLGYSATNAPDFLPKYQFASIIGTVTIDDEKETVTCSFSFGLLCGPGPRPFTMDPRNSSSGNDVFVRFSKDSFSISQPNAANFIGRLTPKGGSYLGDGSVGVNLDGWRISGFWETRSPTRRFRPLPPFRCPPDYLSSSPHLVSSPLAAVRVDRDYDDMRAWAAGGPKAYVYGLWEKNFHRYKR